MRSRRALWAEEWRRIRPAVDAVVAIVAIVLVARYLSAVDGTGPNHRSYGELLEYRVWAALAATSLVVWVLLVGRTLHIALRPLRDNDLPWSVRLQRGLAPLFMYGVVLWALVLGAVPLAGIGLVDPLAPELGHRAFLLVTAGVLAAGPPVVGMWQTYGRLRELSMAIAGRAGGWTPSRFLAELRETWRHAQRCLAVLSILVALGTVLVGAFRNTLLAAGYTAKELPGSVVLLYGAFFTVLSLIVYVPLFIAWRSRVTDYIDRIYPLPDDGRPSEEWMAGRARLLTLLGADITLARNLTAAAGILAPLATSVLAVFVPTTT